MQFTLPIGLPRLVASRRVPPEVRPEFCAVFCRRQYLAEVRGEAAAREENSAQVPTLEPLGKLPLVVLELTAKGLREVESEQNPDLVVRY
jgi:hypothetical protein